MWYEIRLAMGAQNGAGIDIAHWESPESHVPYWVAPLADIRRRVWGRSMLGAQSNMGYEDDFRAEKWIGNALRGPLEAFGVDPGTVEDWKLGEYILNMLPTLHWLVDAADEDAMQVAMRGTFVAIPIATPDWFDDLRLATPKKSTKRRSTSNKPPADAKTPRRKA